VSVITLAALWIVKKTILHGKSKWWVVQRQRSMMPSTKRENRRPVRVIPRTVGEQPVC
jgi:hypothetical protein